MKNLYSVVSFEQDHVLLQKKENEMRELIKKMESTDFSDFNELRIETDKYILILTNFIDKVYVELFNQRTLKELSISDKLKNCISNKVFQKERKKPAKKEKKKAPAKKVSFAFNKAVT